MSTPLSVTIHARADQLRALLVLAGQEQPAPAAAPFNNMITAEPITHRSHTDHDLS